MNRRIAKRCDKLAVQVCSFAAAIGATFLTGFGANAAPLNLSDVPLFITVSSKPNVMIMLDNSGSMYNVVPDSPYDKDVTYSCGPFGTELTNTYRIDIYITSGGTPYFRRDTTYYDWGKGSGGGATGRTKRCFDPNTSYDARLYGDSGGSSSTKSPGTYLPAVYTGNYLNWYFGTNTSNNYGNSASSFGSGGRIKPNVKTRLQIAQSASNSLIDSMSSAMRAGLATYNNGEGGQLLQTIGDIDTAKKSALRSAVNGIAAGGNTPLAETLADIGYYFSRGASELTLHPAGTPQPVSRSSVFTSDYTRDSSWGTGANPIQYSCQKSFAVLMTDGQPQGDRGVSTYLRDYTGDCASGLCDDAANTTNLPNGALTTTTYGNGTKIGRSYESQGSDYLDDIARALYDVDLRPDLTKAPGIKNNVATYLITFADDQAINDPLMQDAADRGGGRKIAAGNEAELLGAFQSALSGIVAKTAAASSASVNSGSISSESRVYQARFNSGTWTGHLLAFPIDTGDGNLKNKIWDAAEKLPAHSSRTIFTANSNGTAVAFRWGDLDSTRRAQLAADATIAQNKLDYLRGDTSKEVSNGGSFRNRRGDDGIDDPLGDVINSAPIFVGRPPFRYSDGLESKSYAVFQGEQKDRPGVVYAGANDGMLHAFDGESGVELFGFVPGKIFGKLTGAGVAANDLTNPSYSHAYFVDGSPNMGDVFYGGQWHTVLIGGYNKGAQGIYALDITDPSDFSEANASDIYRWEFTDADDADLGYSFSQPAIVRMKNGKWAAIFGNGYNNTEADGHASTTGYAVLYIVDIQTGMLIRKISTQAGSTTTPNGLATPAIVDLNGDSIADYAFAGDLQGNLWKFDLSDSNATNWDVAYKSGSTPVPLFIATDEDGNRQPITVRPEVDVGPAGAGMMVLFGTGKYLENSDLFATPQRTQSLYGVLDKNTGTSSDVVTGRTELTLQTIDYELNSINDETVSRVRVTSNNPVGSDKKGWAMDLVSPVYGYQGERLVAYPVLRNNHQVVFTTLIPDSEPCGYGGESWLMELPTWTGGRIEISAFDLNRDGQFYNPATNGASSGGGSGSSSGGGSGGDGEGDPCVSDCITVHDPDRVKLPDGTEVVASGLQSQKCLTCDEPEKSIFAEPGILVDPVKNVEYKYLSGTNGNVNVVTENPGPGTYGRQSWRQRR